MASVVLFVFWVTNGRINWKNIFKSSATVHLYCRTWKFRVFFRRKVIQRAINFERERFEGMRTFKNKLTPIFFIESFRWQSTCQTGSYTQEFFLGETCSKWANPRSWGSPSKISGEFLPIWANFVHCSAEEFAELWKFRPNRKKFAHLGEKNNYCVEL
jgi:hypothetical protein